MVNIIHYFYFYFAVYAYKYNGLGTMRENNFDVLIYTSHYILHLIVEPKISNPILCPMSLIDK
jgi:hypothetical protein